MMKKLMALGAFLAAPFLACSAAHAANYDAVAPAYQTRVAHTACSVGSCADYTSSMAASGTFTMAAPLAANLHNAEISSTVFHWNFNDGLTTYADTDAQSRLLQLLVSTSPTGTLTRVNIIMMRWQAAGAPVDGARYDVLNLSNSGASASHNAPCTTVGKSPWNTTQNACAQAGATDAAVSWAVAPVQSDLSATLTANTSTAHPGDTVTYTLTARNEQTNWRDIRTTVHGSFAPLLACNWTCAGTMGGLCTANGTASSTDPLNDGDVFLPQAGSTATYTATCTVAASATGSLVSAAQVDSNMDTNPANNSATHTLVIQPLAASGPASVPTLAPIALALLGGLLALLAWRIRA